MPTLVKREAKKKEVSVVTESLTKKNYAIIDHWNEGKVQKLINSKKFDFVIIQQGPSSQTDGYNMLINDGEKYADLCNLNGAKLAYFMVWPSKTYYYTFDKVIENYTKGAITNNAIICPVGKVWKEYFDQTSDFSYYGKDRFHPSLLGSQVAAKVIVKSLFKK